MKLYKTTGEFSPGATTPAVWSGSQADAAKARKELKAQHAFFVETEEINVPTDKAGLLVWLNTNCLG